MQIKIEVNEEYITELVSQAIADNIIRERTYENREAKNGIRDGIDKAIKQYIYAKKDVVIDRVVDRASAEITRKAMPKLVDRMMGDAE